MVASYVQLIEKRYADALDADGHEFIAFAVDGARRMQALINDLLTYSRVGTRAKPFAPTDGNALLEEVLSNLEVAIAEADAEVTHGPLPRVVADRAQLARVFQNLIGNALKYCEARPRVHVSAERDGHAWRFDVRDNGIGVDPDQRDRIFVIFQRLHRREAYEGTGMGLAITKKIVQRHGGRIWVDDAPGGGSIFSFTLPDRKEPSDANDDPEAAGDADAGPGPAGRDPARRGQPRRHPAHARGPARG
jgi:light-regulated signal transduction histidine kinase (bacteriophytochrome)